MPNNRRGLFIVLLLLVGLFLGLTAVRQTQLFKKKAALSITGTLSFPQVTYVNPAPGGNSTVTVGLHTGSQPIVGGDVLVRFDTSRLTLTAITPITAFRNSFLTFLPVTSAGVFDTPRIIACATSGSYNGSAAYCPSGPGVVEFGFAAFNWSTNLTTPAVGFSSTTQVATLTFQAKSTLGPTVIRFIPTSGYTDSSFSSTTNSNLAAVTTTDPITDILATPASTSVVTLNIASTTPTPDPTGAPTSTPIPGSCQTGTATWGIGSPFTIQTGTFSVEFDATPGAASMDGVVGLSNGSATAYTSLATAVRFWTDGTIEARNGGAYVDASTPVTYTAGTRYHFKLDINIGSHTYSAYVTPPGSTQKTLGTNMAFRTEQATVSQLNYWNVYAASGSLSVCNFVLGTGVQFRPGDADRDGDVDLVDLGIWARDYGLSTSPANFNSDSVVNGLDYLIWRTNFLPSPTSTPTPTTTGPTRTPTPTPAPPTPTRTPTPTPSGPTPTFPPPQTVQGIWTSPSDLAGKPMSGTSWDRLKTAADSSYTPDIDNQDSATDVNMLAGAIVYARNGDATYRNKVISALNDAVSRFGNCQATGRTLAWARNMAAYPLAADLVGYRTPAFEQFLRDMADRCVGSQNVCPDNRLYDACTLRTTFSGMPNNWGQLAFGALAAIYRYLGDTPRLQAVRYEWVNELLYNVNNINNTVSRNWSSDKSWFTDPNNLRIINPVEDSVKGGIIPEDAQRCGSYSSGCITGYTYDTLSGMVVGARVLQRAGMPIWQEGNEAIYRAGYRYFVIRNPGGSYGITKWVIPFINSAYPNRNPLPDSRDRDWGWQAGYPYVLP